MINNIIIKCPTYKDAFILRKALIELNIKWANLWNLNGISGGTTWKDLWQKYNCQTCYIINNKALLLFGDVNSIPHLYSKLPLITVSQFIENYFSK